MRLLFSVLGLLLVVAIVGVLARQGLTGRGPLAVEPAAGAVPLPAAPATPQQQVQQFRQALDAQLQQARPMPDDPR